MRADPRDYELAVPRTLSEAVALLGCGENNWLPIAGGTDLMVLYNAGKLKHRKLLNIWNLPELRRIEAADDEIRIGAGCTYTEVREHPLIQRELPLLPRSASWTGGIAIQNRGTLGGNIANASPAADSLPVLLVYDADLLLVSARGERRLPYREFHTGYKQTKFAPGELIRAVCIKRNLTGYVSYSRKVGGRNAQAISKVFLTGIAKMSNSRVRDIRLAAGSVAPVPLRLSATESTLKDRVLDGSVIQAARNVLNREIQPIDDIRSSLRYRTVVMGNLLEEFLTQLKASESTA